MKKSQNVREIVHLEASKVDSKALSPQEQLGDKNLTLISPCKCEVGSQNDAS